MRVIVNRFALILALLCLSGPLARAAFDRDYNETINGTKLHFRERGESERNPYLLILHGGPGFSSHMFYVWGRSLEKTVTVVYLDQRGSGESERLKFKNAFAPTPDEIKDYTLANLLKDIEGVREFLKIKKWAVLGHSWGGMLGIEYVTAYPERVSGYLHVDGLISWAKAEDAILDFSEKQVSRDEQSADKTKKERAASLKPYLPYARKLPVGPERLFSCLQFARALIEEMYFADPNRYEVLKAQAQQAVKEYAIPDSGVVFANEPLAALVANDHIASRDETPLFAEIRCRTLVINGQQDSLITPQSAALAQKQIKNSRLILLDHCGHFPFVEQPEAFTKLVIDFVKK